MTEIEFEEEVSRRLLEIANHAVGVATYYGLVIAVSGDRGECFTCYTEDFPESPVLTFKLNSHAYTTYGVIHRALILPNVIFGIQHNSFTTPYRLDVSSWTFNKTKRKVLAFLQEMITFINKNNFIPKEDI